LLIAAIAHVDLLPEKGRDSPETGDSHGIWLTPGAHVSRLTMLGVGRSG
jgi:hypothetical protein